jgi:tetratricopeptide (TPR) repeat protein
MNTSTQWWTQLSLVVALAACTSASKASESGANEPTSAAPRQPEVSNATAPDSEQSAGRAMTKKVGDLGNVGKVEYRLDCARSVQADFDRGLALLHSFFYAEARKSFEAVIAKDSECASGHWGVAMTWYHPIWAAPTPEAFKAGKQAIQAATKATKKNKRDEMLIASLVAFYEANETGGAHPTGQSCHGPSGAHPARARAFSDKLKAAHEAFPDDIEIASFYALSLLGSAPPVDRELKNQKAAAAVLEPWWARRKDHPGVPHYLIHAYDYPSLASKGLEAAKAYAAIAPNVPHVLHMPSHIFVRLGMWLENIESNLASASAARAYGEQVHPGAMGFEELHALDYLVYGYLQTGHEPKAKEIVDLIPAITKTFPEIDFVSSYALAAIPARYAVERHDWSAASTLHIPDMPFWTQFPFTEAHIEYARGLGRARSGDVAGATKSMKRLGDLRDATTNPAFAYFRKHVDLQVKAITAWIKNAQGKQAQAIKLLKEAAAAEDELGKHPVSPGPVYPIYDQLGELLLSARKPADALAAFKASLVTSPRRFNSLFGAGKAAAAAKKQQDARTYFEQLIAMAGDSERPELAEAKAFVAKQ